MLFAAIVSTFFVSVKTQGFRDCALVVTSPTTTISSNSYRSPYRGQFEEQRTCITYQAVDSAFAEAQTKLGYSRSQVGTSVNQVGELGTVLHETSRILERRYGLSTDAVAKGLPLIDTKRTLIHQYCPAFLMTPRCQLHRYRTMSGQCNNLENPHWGAAMTSHQRFLPADYSDGVSYPRMSSSGRLLPNPRLVSTKMHKDDGYHDHAVTLLLVAWGQFVDHDITRAAETKDPTTKKTPRCCEGGREAQNPNCFPISISSADPFYRRFGEHCMNFVRHQVRSSSRQTKNWCQSP